MARRDFSPQAPLEALVFTLATHDDLWPREESVPQKIAVFHPAGNLHRGLFPTEHTIVFTPDKPVYDQLIAAGYKVTTDFEATEEFDACAVFPVESRDESFYLFALATKALKSGGTLLVSMPNDVGASRFEDKLAELIGKVHTNSKYHCRVFGGTKHGPESEDHVNVDLQNEWLKLGIMRCVPKTNFHSVPGLFSWDRVDTGSELLIEHVPADLGGSIGDLGCGYGFLSKSLLIKCGNLKELLAFDSDRRAVVAAKQNLSESETTAKVDVQWLDVRVGMPKNRFDAIVMNPPFHTHGSSALALGERFFAAAHAALRTGGSAYAVVNRHLPYDKPILALFSAMNELVEKRGFRILQAFK